MESSPTKVGNCQDITTKECPLLWTKNEVMLDHTEPMPHLWLHEAPRRGLFHPSAPDAQTTSWAFKEASMIGIGWMVIPPSAGMLHWMTHVWTPDPVG